MKTLYRYFLIRVLMASLVSLVVLTLILVFGNAFKRVFDLLVNYDVPLLSIVKILVLLIPQALTFTLPWALLMGVMIVLGRASHDLELQAVSSAGIGLAPLISPIVLLSLFVSLVCFLNNAFLAPRASTEFRWMLVDLGKNNPTALLKAGEMIDRFPGYRIWIGKKFGNVAENIHIWELAEDMIPRRSIRADRGTISADLNEQTLTITLINARQEQRGADLSDFSRIQSGMRAQQLPLKFSLRELFDTSRIDSNITIQTMQELSARLLDPKRVREPNAVPLLTEFQKRMAFSFAPFTFVLMGIPLAIRFHRKETSIGVLLSFGVVMAFYMMQILAMALKEKAVAYPELIVWLPNIIFQLVGFWLLWRANSKALA